MQIRDTKENYGFVTRFIHWLIFVLILFQLLLGFIMVDFTSKIKIYNAYTIHKSMGIVILCVALFFVIWRWSNPRPVWPKGMKRLEQLSAHAVHIVLYWFIIITPITGWAMATAAGKPPYFFYLFYLPMPLISYKHELAETAKWLHLIFASVLCGVIGIHLLAALKHFFIDKDRIFQRMWKN